VLVRLRHVCESSLLLGAGIICMFSSTYNGEYEDVKAVHDGVGEPVHEQGSLS